MYNYVTVFGISADYRTMKIDLALYFTHASNTPVGEILRKRFPESLWLISIYSEKFWFVI